MYVGLKQPRGDGEHYVTPARAAAKETIAWEDLHRYPNPFNAAAYLMQTLEPPRRPLADLLACWG